MIVDKSFPSKANGYVRAFAGSEVVKTDTGYVARIGCMPGGTGWFVATQGGIKEIPLPADASAKVVVSASCSEHDVRYQASAIIICPDSDEEICRLEEPVSVGGGYTYPTEKEAIRSILPENFPRKVKYYFPGPNCPFPSESWEEAINANPGWESLDWWQECRKAVLSH